MFHLSPDNGLGGGGGMGLAVGRVKYIVCDGEYVYVYKRHAPNDDARIPNSARHWAAITASLVILHSFIHHPRSRFFPPDTPVPYPYTLPHTIPCPRLSSSNFLLFQAIRPHSSKTCYPHRSSQKHSSSPFQRFNSWPQRWKG